MMAGIGMRGNNAEVAESPFRRVKGRAGRLQIEHPTDYIFGPERLQSPEPFQPRAYLRSGHTIEIFAQFRAKDAQHGHEAFDFPPW